jgi:hypothetical protein
MVEWDNDPLVIYFILKNEFDNKKMIIYEIFGLILCQLKVPLDGELFTLLAN